MQMHELNKTTINVKNVNVRKCVIINYHSYDIFADKPNRHIFLFRNSIENVCQTSAFLVTFND